MFTLMFVVFVLDYTAIALEHTIKIDKAATALITGALCWGIYALAPSDILNFSNQDSINTIARSELITPGFKDFLWEKVIDNSIQEKYHSTDEILEHHEFQAPIYQVPAGETAEIATTLLNTILPIH